MTFEGQYLTYAEYQALGGSAIGEMPFNLLEFEARRQIDIRTFNRLQNLDTQPQEVKLCMYSLINCINSYFESSSDKNISSKSIDGVSVSYVDSTRIKEAIVGKNAEIEDIIFEYLVNVVVNNEHILYLGVC